MRAIGGLTLHVAEPRLDVAALRRIPTVEGNLVLLQKMLIEAIGVDIISTGWALVDSDWPHNRQSSQGTSNRHCARFDVAGRCLAVAAATGSGNRGQLEQQNGYGRWYKYSTYDDKYIVLR